MMNRRGFLKIVALSATLPASSYLVSNLIEQRPNNHLYSSFYLKWKEYYGKSPEDYLSSIEVIIDSKDAYRKKIKEDFFMGEVFEFEGFFLSKTEAAGLASLFRLGNATF